MHLPLDQAPSCQQENRRQAEISQNNPCTAGGTPGKTEVTDSTLHRMLIFYVNLDISMLIGYFQALVGNVRS